MENKGRIVGIGGVFFKCKDVAATKKRYSDKMGLKTDQYGATFAFKKLDAGDVGTLQWSAFPSDTKYFLNDEQEFMINYRVENLEPLVENLKADGVVFTDEIENFEYGKFIHMLDADGRLVELWEPVDAIFTDNVDLDTFNHE